MEVAIWVLGALVLFGLMTISEKLRKLDRKLDVLTRLVRGETVSPPEVSEQVRRLAESGQTIQAIRQLREELGLGLKEAKDIIDDLDLRLPAASHQPPV